MCVCVYTHSEVKHHCFSARYKISLIQTLLLKRFKSNTCICVYVMYVFS